MGGVFKRPRLFIKAPNFIRLDTFRQTLKKAQFKNYRTMSYQGLGNKISTSSPECRALINHGMLNSYGFKREVAISCFQKALEIDSNCPIAHCFIAYNNAADYNNPGGFDYGKGYQESQKALEIASKMASIPDWELAVIEAQTHRFCWPVGSKPMDQLHKDYAKAMREVYNKYGENDTDITTLFAESLMMLAPWALWTKPPEIKPAIEETIEIVATLEKGLEIDPVHPGLAHFYIHVMELSPTPEKALPTSDLLRAKYPDQGHLIHMPSHIDMWVGQYKEAIETNEAAIVSDKAYKANREADIEMYDLYIIHNYHFAVWAALFDGQYATAVEHAEGVEKQLGVDVVTSTFGGTSFGPIWMEAFASLPWHVLVRFGKWQEIIDRPMDKDKDIYAGTTAVAYYARAIAFAVLGKANEADRERANFYTALNNKALEGRHLFNNPMHDPVGKNGVLDIAEAVLNGEVEYHRGNFDEAFKWLNTAVERDANLIYDEPWGWMVPARHVLGALLLEHKEAAKAEEVYREDLKQYKNNMWSLLGLYQALKEQKKNEKEAEEVLRLFKEASVRCDKAINVGASCLCATKLCSK